MDKKLLIAGAVFGMTAIVLGAFGAHALKQILSEAQLQTFETGVKYQMYHALFLLVVGMYGGISDKVKRTILYLIVAGVFFFSGSIYLLATNAVPGINKIIGPITPLGGLSLILGWLVLLVHIFRKKS